MFNKTLLSFAIATFVGSGAAVSSAQTGEHQNVPPQAVQADYAYRPPPTQPMSCVNVCAGTDARGICTSWQQVCR